MDFIIDRDIFPHFPGIRIVVAVAHGVDVTEEARKQIRAELSSSWRFAGTQATAYGNAQSHPNIVPWVARMKALGAPRKHFPCSVEALVRRAGKQDVPAYVNPLVDFYNAVSLKNIVPAGGYDIDALKHGLSLRFSGPGDTFRALDDEADIDVPPGEVSYTDGNVVITRQFVWRQSRHALLEADSKNIFFLSEILGELPDETLVAVRDAFASGIEKFLGVTPKIEVLDEKNPGMTL